MVHRFRRDFGCVVAVLGGSGSPDSVPSSGAAEVAAGIRFLALLLARVVLAV